MEQILNLQNTGEKDYHFEESVKTLRTNLQFCGSSLKTIMFTSSLGNELVNMIVYSFVEAA